MFKVFLTLLLADSIETSLYLEFFRRRERRGTDLKPDKSRFTELLADELLDFFFSSYSSLFSSILLIDSNP